LASLADVGVVVLFVAIGRRSHDDDGSSVTGALRVAAPFVIALAIAWLLGRVWMRPLAWRSGVVVWIGTVVAGVLLRRVVFDRGTAAGFVVVAGIFMGALFNGWRALARRRSRPDGPSRDAAREAPATSCREGAGGAKRARSRPTSS
jgi:hypothetical protein